MKNGFTITQRNAVVEQHLWCIDTIMAQYAAFMQTEPVDPDDVYQSLAVRLIRAVNSYDPRKGYLKEYILSQLKREMVRIRSTQAVYGLTQAPANIGGTIVPLTIAAQRESYWDTYIAVCENETVGKPRSYLCPTPGAAVAAPERSGLGTGKKPCDDGGRMER